MIVPNLMVTDIERSVACYRDVMGMALMFALGPGRDMRDSPAGAVFASLEWNGGQLMLQSAGSLAAELPMFTADSRPTASGTVYFRGLDPDEVHGRAAADQIVKAPFQQWYGMREVYLLDPDGYVICAGRPEGAPPG